MDPGDPEIKEEILDAAIKLENIDKLINDFDDDDEDDDEDFKYISEDDDDDSDYNYKSSTPIVSSLRNGRSRIKQEVILKNGTSKLSCQSCQKSSFLSQANLNKHIGQNLKCKLYYESQGILPSELLAAHQRRKNQSKENTQKTNNDSLGFQCKKCKKHFSSEGGVNRHVSKIKACKRYYDKLQGLEHLVTDGLTPRQSYYMRNRERVIQKQREYYQRNADRVRVRRVQHYRSRQMASLFDEGDFAFKKGSGYLERHKEYYEKNKDTIKERRRNYYYVKKEALTKKVGRFEFAKISAIKNLAEIPDPFEPYGRVKIENLSDFASAIAPKNNLTKSFKRRKAVNAGTSTTNEDIDYDEDEEAEVEKNAKVNSSPLGTCHNYRLASKPGESKLNHDALIGEEDLITMPHGTKLSPSAFDYINVQNVESFVGLTISKDGESIEVCHLLQRNHIDLEAIRRLIHGICSVLSIDLKIFVQEKSCPVNLFNPKHMHLLKDRLTRDLQKLNNILPSVTPSICTPVASTEVEFLDENMKFELPHQQLLVNEDLVSSDLGAVGVQWRENSNLKQIKINPIFSVNSVDHWRYRMRHFYTLLVNWVGSKILLNQIFHMLPCMITAKEAFFDEVRLDCHKELQKPMETKICEHCGEVFQFSKYTLQTRRAYARHVQLHDHNCKICGESFPNGTQRKFHERSHKEHSVKCPHSDNCHYVGSSQQAVDTHVKHAHSTLICDLCGKVTVAQNLKLHMATHHAPKTFEHICNVCGKGYSTKNILDKHVRRHNNPDSLINKWMTEPNEFKFECKEHNNCKKYFKSERRLKEHLRRYAGKTYPNNLARQYVPNLPENHSTIVDSTNIVQVVNVSGHGTPIVQGGSSDSKKEENDNDIAGNNSSSKQPYKKRKKELAESLFLDKKLKAIFNHKQQQETESLVENNIKVETLASSAVASEAVSPPVGNSDNYQQHQQNQQPLSTAVVLEDHRGPQIHPQFYQLYQAGHMMATSAMASSASEYSTAGGGQTRPSFRPFPDLSSATSNHTNY